MSDASPNTVSLSQRMGPFERHLTLWVVLCILVGTGLGYLFPGAFAALGGLEIAKVNLPVAVLIWLMIIPMLLKIDFAALGDVTQHWKGIGVTVFVNWAIKPFSMALLAWIFIRHVFADYLPAAQIDSYVAGLILLAAAPCTAMVFVWSQLCGGDARFTLSQVALNDAIMVVAFAPIVGLLLGISSITVPWSTLLISVGMYIIVPVIIAVLVRRWLLRRGGEAALQVLLKRLGPVSLSALLVMLVLLFGFQGRQIVDQPLIIGVSADVKLTHSAEVKVTHLGHDGGLLKAADVDSGAGSGDTCDGPQGRECQSDREAIGVLAQHRAQIPARSRCAAVRPARVQGLQARRLPVLSA